MFSCGYTNIMPKRQNCRIYLQKYEKSATLTYLYEALCL